MTKKQTNKIEILKQKLVNLMLSDKSFEINSRAEALDMANRSIRVLLGK
jgi:acetylornithine/succinyldiaminopimelate/putrescine aminotransferase